jgi:integrase
VGHSGPKVVDFPVFFPSTIAQIKPCRAMANRHKVRGESTNESAMAKFKTVAQSVRDGDGRYNAGDSLYLVVRGGSALWEHQFRDGGKLKARSYGSAVGAAPVGLTQARALAWADRLERRARRQTARNARFHVVANGNAYSPAVATLFAVARDQYFANMQGGAVPQWTPEQFETLKRMMAKHAAALDNRPVGAITLDDMADLLRPIWKGPGSHTGNRVRGMVEKILRSAGVKDNPAMWENLETRLSNKIAKSVPRAALPFADVPAFMCELAADSTPQARALRFMILTATRQDETLEATWRELDLVGKVWTIPGTRMKMTDDHKVPLSDAAIAILGPRGGDDALVFPSKVGGRMSQQTIRELAQELRPDVKVTPHGFRSSMATWAEEQDGGREYPAKVIDAALAHYKGDTTTKAYQRSTLFDPRKKMMAAWASFATNSN